MAKKDKQKMVNIDGIEYPLDKLSETAKAQLESIQFVDAQIQQLSNELAVADGSYRVTNALRGELKTPVRIIHMGKKIRVDDIDYDLDNLSDKAKASLIYLEFITTVKS